MDIYFSDVFRVSAETIDDYGAFNVSLIGDLPLFIDPFLLFNSKKAEYQELHAAIIRYLLFLRDKALAGSLSKGLVDAWFRFPEVKQNYFGFCLAGNRGSGLGHGFATSLLGNLQDIFSDFGNEKVTTGQHLEKLCLIRDGVGRDNISDFTTNLIKGHLCGYTQGFAQKHVSPSLRSTFSVRGSKFDYEREAWTTESFDLPKFNGDYVLLTPRDLLTKDDIWISKHDLLADFERIANAIPNEQLRAQVDNYFRSRLSRNPTERERDAAKRQTLLKFKQVIDYYIRDKERHGDKAVSVSNHKVEQSRQLYVLQFKELIERLEKQTGFYSVTGDTEVETRQRILFFKDLIENKDGYKLLYANGEAPKREDDVQILYRFVWFGTPSDVNREPNNGRGPVDYKVSRGSSDKTLIEFKLASNTSLRRNLENQVAIYEKANDTKKAFKVILFFTDHELAKVKALLRELKLESDARVILIDARRNNKQSASKVSRQTVLL